MARELKFIVAGIIFLAYSFVLNSQTVASNSQELFNSLSLIDPHKHPDCTEPSDVRLYTFSNERIEFNWAGPSAPKNGIRYLVRYRFFKDGLTYPWNDQLISEGRSCVITRIISNSTVEIELKKLCDGIGSNYSLSSDWVPVLKKDLSDFSRDLERGAEECSFITDAHAQRTSDSTYFVHITSTAPQNNHFWRYMVRYKACVANPSEQITYILTDTSTTISCPHEGLCEIQVRIIWGGQDTNYVSWCPWRDILLNGNNNPPQAPCSTGTPANPTNPYLLNSASIGDVFTVSGLPFVLDYVEGSNGNFSGTGTLSFPFGNNQHLSVTFSNITVNAYKEVSSGTVNGISSGLQPYNISGGTFNWGGKICQEKPNKEGWNPDGTWGATGLSTDPYGFDINGKFRQLPPYDGYKTGDPYDDNYDPNGFDVDGINKFTGSKFGPNGCSREGVDSLGHKCDPSDGKGPYWWLNGGGFSSAGKKFYSEIEDSLQVNLEALIDEIIESMNDSLSVKDVLCDSLRNLMDTKITSLSYTAEFIKGQNGKYFAPGMSKHFANRPQELITKIDRRPGQDVLEKAHVDLYQCDLDWTKYDEIGDLLNALKDTSNIHDFIADLKEKIEHFTQEEVDRYHNEEEFYNWLKKQIEDRINKDRPGSFGCINHRSKGYNSIPDLNHEEVDPNDFITSNTASLEPMDLSNTDLKREIEFQLKQGWTNILGTHKALIFEQIKIQRNLLGSTLTGEENKMPIIVKKEILGKEEAIYFDHIRLGPQTGLMDVYFVLTIPTTGQKFVFQATDVEFASGGLTGAAKLTIANNLEIRVNNTTMLVVEGNDPDTYVEFDCDGLKEISIKSYLEFCREFLTPLKSNFDPDDDPAKRVRAYFKVKMAGWGQFMATINVDPFAVTNASDIKWVVHEATLDFSDQESPGITFPQNYDSEFVDSQTNSPKTGWRGVSIKTLQATLPKKFSKNNSPDITVGAYDVIFDGMGFTGSVSATNILSIQDGNIGGWAMSIDTMSVSFVKNQIAGGRLAGLINVPLFTENMGYSAAVHPNNEYEFSVRPGDTMTANLWLAKVHLLQSSSISIREKNAEFEIKALLNGFLSVDGALGSMNLKVPNIGFENVGISNKTPYFDPGVWTTTGTAGIKCGAFEITAKNIGLSKGDAGDTEVKLGMDVHIGLTDEKAGSIGADARLYVVGEYEEVNGKQNWKYKKITISSVYVNADIAGSHIEGGLSFYEQDATYGTGFKGKLDAKFKGLAEVLVLGQFGQLPDYKYFFVDAMVLLDHPIGMGAMALYGLGGGLYYRMIRPQMSSLQLANWNGDDLQTGQTPSGITYTPTKDVGFGFRFTLALSSNVKEAFNCIVTLDMAFGENGGVKKMELQGNGQFMATPDFGALPVRTPGSAPNNALLSINVDIQFDFDNSVFDGKLEVFANVADVLRGGGPNNRMATAVIHFGAGSWYIKVGSPRDPCYTKITLPIIGELANIKTYLQIGTDIDDMIPLSERGFDGLNVRNVPSLARNRGTGFAFGADLNFGFDEKTFLIFYAKLKIDLGFDLMVGKFADVYCSNTNSEIGINGWFAQGQAWADVDASVGIKVKLWFIKGKFHILDFNAGVALAAKLPNPFFAAGTVKGKFSILGGLVRGTCSFKFSTGELCQQEVDTGVAYLGIITGINPDNGSNEVEATTIPEAYFYLPVGKEVQDFDPNDPNKVRKYLAKLNSVTLKNKSNQEIAGKVVIADEGYTLKYKTLYYLPAYDTLTFSVTVDVYQDGVFYGSESRQTIFVTGAPVTDIPIANIDGAYPMVGMKYLYQKEFRNGKGYIHLSYGQPEFFIGMNPGDIVLRFTSSNQNIEVPCNYDFAKSQIEFDIPNLSHNMDYKLKLVNKKQTNGNDEKILCAYHFHTSQYDYFKDKVIQFVQNSSITGENKVGRNRTLISTIDEPFDNQEINGGLIKSTLDLSNEKPYMYSIISRLSTLQLWGCNDCYDFKNYIKTFSPPFDEVALKSKEISFTLPQWLFNAYDLYKSKAATCKFSGWGTNTCNFPQKDSYDFIYSFVPEGTIILSYFVQGLETGGSLSNVSGANTSIVTINLNKKSVK